MRYRRGKKGKTHWIGSALRQGEVKTLQHSDYTIWWFRGSLRIRWHHAPQQIAVPFAWFRRDSLHVTPQASSTIRPNIEIFRVMLSNLMFRESVWCSAKLFDITLHHLCVRCTILHYAKPFHATLHHFCVRCTIRLYAEPFHERYTVCMYAVPFYITLSYFTQCYIICAYAVLLDITLCHLT